MQKNNKIQMISITDKEIIAVIKFVKEKKEYFGD